MRRIVLLAVAAALLGLVVGYLIFARTAAGYVSLKTLLRPSQGGLDDLVKAITGIHEVRRKVLVSGAAGAGVGLLIALAAIGTRRRR